MAIKSNLISRIGEWIINRYVTSDFYEDEMLLHGSTALDVKRMIWDSEYLPFTPENWDAYGFKVFSQGNEDGLIQYLINHVEIPNKTFVEFGVEDYSECNTKFLLLHDNWTGLCMDGSKEAMLRLRNRKLYWLHTIEAKAAFITKENINELISESGFSGDIGLLSTDIDGVDYWVLDAIECVRPRILICEFNPLFGSKEKITIPYKADFYRTDVHYSNQYWGASLGAFVDLADKKGFKLVCINNFNCNAFFVRRDIENTLPEVSIEDAFREPKYRDTRDKDGRLTFLSSAQGKALIEDMEVVDIETGKTKKVCELQM